MHKSKICYLSVYNLWSNCCFRSLNRVTSHNIFFLLYTHVQLQHAHGSEGDIYERLDLSVSFVSASCACDWSEGSLCMSKYADD